MITSHKVIIGGHSERTWIICHFNVPIPPQLILFLRVPVSSLFLVCVLETVCLFVIIYITFLGYLLTKIIDNIEEWCHWLLSFRGSWTLNTLEIIIVGLLLEFIFAWLHPISNDHIFDIVPCICFSFDILLLEEIYEAILINVMTKRF